MTALGPKVPLPTGAAYDAEHGLMMRLGESVNAAHYMAAIAPEAARSIDLDARVDRWEHDLAVLYWRAVGTRDVARNR